MIPVIASRPRTGLRTNPRTGPMLMGPEPCGSVQRMERASGRRASPDRERDPQDRLGVHRGQVSSGGLVLAGIRYGS